MTEALREIIDELASALDLASRDIPAGSGTLADWLSICSDNWFEKVLGLSSHLMGADPKEKNKDSGIIGGYLRFEWMETAKALSLLLRDSLFELQKSNHLLFEGKITSSAYEDHEESIRQTLLTRLREVRESLPGFGAEKDRTPNLEWRHYKNPVPIYVNQFETIYKQIVQLRDQSLVVLTLNCFVNLKKEISTELNTRISKMNEDISTFNGFAEKLSVSNLSNLKELTDDLNKIRSTARSIHFQPLRENIRRLIAECPAELRLISAIQESSLVERQFKLSEELNVWMDAEILPLLGEMESESISIYSSIDNILSHISSRLVLARQIDAVNEGFNSDLRFMGQKIFKELNLKGPLHDQINTVKELIEQKLEHNLNLTCLYNSDRNILQVSLQSTLKRLSRDHSALLDRLSRWIGSNISWLRDRYLGPERSISERLVQTIQNRQLKPESLSYASIFMSEGYPGRAFYISRPKAFERLAFNVYNWKNDYSGSLLLWGERFCGKTAFGFHALRAHFGTNVIELRPYSSLTLNGRKEKIGIDLHQALQFVIKNSESGKYALWIDDLELWSSIEHPRYKNIDALINALTLHGSRYFFLVSCSSWLKMRLDHLLQFSDLFQGSCSLDKMSSEEITEAILLRHSATQTQMMDEKGEELGTFGFRRNAKEIYKMAKGNVGDALKLWAISARVIAEHEIIVQAESITFVPELNDKEKAQLLQSLLLERVTNDKMIRHLFGPAFDETYRAELRRMIQIGIVIRNDDGSLGINPFVVNDFSRQLLNKADRRALN